MRIILWAVDSALASKGTGGRGTSQRRRENSGRGTDAAGLQFCYPAERGGSKGSHHYGGPRPGQMAQPSGARRALRIAGKTPAEWASKGTGLRYAKFGRHVRYRLSDVMDWERKQFAEEKRHPA